MILETDRPWAAYALADLGPGYFEHTTWFGSEGDLPALALIYSGFATPVLIAVGEVEALRPILEEIEATLNIPELYGVVRPEVIPLLGERYRLSEEKAMLRMVLDPARYNAQATDGVEQLGPRDLEAVYGLYADGEPNGESPDWFQPEMLAQGVYYGAREAGHLVAIAGTHIVLRSEGVGCLGNIYTRRDRRGRGLSTQVAAAVAAHLRGMNLRTIVLNVRENNTPAIRVYERLGFQRYCDFVEAVCMRI